MFDNNHTMSLALEGRVVPRRKPGRPRKIRLETSVEEVTDLKSSEEVLTEDVDPEEALELMFKEAEEKRQSAGDGSNMRRRRRIPRRLVYS